MNSVNEGIYSHDSSSSLKSVLPLQNPEENSQRVGDFLEDEIFSQVTETAIAVPEGTISMVGKSNRPFWLKSAMAENSKARMFLIYVCFYVCSVGTFFAWFSMSASLFHWSVLYTDNILLFMTAAYSSPAFFIQLLQARFDFRFNMRFGKIRAFRFRMVLLLSVLIASIAAVPFLPSNLGAFLSIIFLMGVASSACYGTLFQLVSLYPKKATSFLSLGYASPGVLLLFVTTLVFGSPPVSNSDRLYLFFGIVIVLLLLALASFLFLLFLSSSILQEIRLRTISKSERTPIAQANSSDIYILPTDQEVPNNWKILKVIWKSVVGITLLMISRVTVFTILPHVPSTEPQKVFAQGLVFINLGGDLCGRFITVICPRLPQKWASVILLAIALFHFSSLNVVLLYIFGEGLIPLSDLAVQITLAFFAVTTGFLQTNFYAYAAIGVPDKFKTQVGALMNVATQIGNFSGLGFSFFLRFAVF